MIVRGAARFRALLLDININVHDYTLTANCNHLITTGQRVIRGRIRLAWAWITGKLTRSSFVPKHLAQITALYFSEG